MSSGGSAADPARAAAVVPLVSAWRVDRPFDYLIPESLAGGVVPGALVRVTFGHRRVRGVVVATGRAEPGRPLEPVLSVVLEQPVAPPPLLEMADWIARRYASRRSAAFRLLVPPRIRVAAAPPGTLPGRPGSGALEAYEGGADMLREIESGSGGAWCLRSLPGAARGAVVTDLVAAASRVGGAALVAVPEVRHDSEVLAALTAEFGDVARIDSAVGDSHRAQAWKRLAEGHVLGYGGRSAVLAPAAALRLIVVDDESHPSLKEERSPRYETRVVALRRAALQGAVCVLIATAPSLEAGMLRPVMPARAARRAARPVVELVEAPAGGWLSPELQSRVAGAVRSGKRVALLAAHRGWARAVWCAQCRRSLRCPVCEAGLAYDYSPRRLRCPRCGREEDASAHCPACGAGALRYLGSGTQRLGEQVAKAWPRAHVAVTGPAAAAPEADIYVTKWTGTGEAVRPLVDVVGVLDADALIRRPDFRAAESAYRALAEMAAWAGPACDGGHLLIQTSEPNHHSIQAVVRADYDYFARRELVHRRELGYPPFSELVKVSAQGPDAHALQERASDAARTAGGRVLGPIAVHNRLEILVKCRDALPVADALRAILGGVPAGNRLTVDVDPR